MSLCSISTCFCSCTYALKCWCERKITLLSPASSSLNWVDRHLSPVLSNKKKKKYIIDTYRTSL
jgi:hypothetical protein